MISLDKYDVYYPFIKDKEKYNPTLFFSCYDTLQKDYQYCNMMQLLSEEILKNKDVYYYDDTHWSPLGAEIAAKELDKMLQR